MGIEKILSEIGTQKIEDLSIQSGDLAYGTQARVNYPCGDTLTRLQAVYVTTDGYVARARADASGTMPAIGVVLDTETTTGNLVRVAVGGLQDGFNFSGYIGRTAFVSPATAGLVTPVPGATSGQILQKVGVAVNTSTLLIQVGAMLQVSGASY